MFGLTQAKLRYPYYHDFSLPGFGLRHGRGTSDDDPVPTSSLSTTDSRKKNVVLTTHCTSIYTRITHLCIAVSLPPCYQMVSSYFSFSSLGGGHFAYSYILDRSIFFSLCCRFTGVHTRCPLFFGRGDLIYYWEGWGKRVGLLSFTVLRNVHYSLSHAHYYY